MTFATVTSIVRGRTILAGAGRDVHREQPDVVERYGLSRTGSVFIWEMNGDSAHSGRPSISIAG